MLYPELTYKIRECVFNIYNKVGPGFGEATYEAILMDALRSVGLKVECQREFEVYYKHKRVGLYRTDLIVEDKIILELKAVPEVYPLHKAQIISYLKVTNLRLGMLVNFGGSELYVRGFPNKNYRDLGNQGLNSRSISVDFNIEKVNLGEEDKRLVTPYLLMAKEILEILGPGYFHQVYRRAFWYEINWNGIDFELIKQVSANYNGRIYQTIDVRLFRVDNLLISIVAVESVSDLLREKFKHYMRQFNCSKGLMINFNSLIVDYKLQGFR